ncbi:MAG: hypothetical protein E5W93_05540, partial [Mesorhizobium sp.]
MRFSRANPAGASAYGDNDDSRPDARHQGAAAAPQGKTGQVVTLRASVEGESNAASFDSAGDDEFGRPA